MGCFKIKICHKLIHVLQHQVNRNFDGGSVQAWAQLRGTLWLLQKKESTVRSIAIPMCAPVSGQMTFPSLSSASIQSRFRGLLHWQGTLLIRTVLQQGFKRVLLECVGFRTNDYFVHCFGIRSGTDRLVFQRQSKSQRLARVSSPWHTKSRGMQKWTNKTFSLCLASNQVHPRSVLQHQDESQIGPALYRQVKRSIELWFKRSLVSCLSARKSRNRSGVLVRSGATSCLVRKRGRICLAAQSDQAQHRVRQKK